MDQRRYVKPKRAIIFKVIFALSIAFLLLGFIVIKLSSHQRKLTYAKKLALPKMTQPSPTALKEDHQGWRIINARPGDTLASIFKQAGLSRQTLQTILYKNKHAKTLSAIKAGQEIKLQLNNNVLDKLIIPMSATQYLSVSRTKNTYVSEVKSYQMDTHNEFVSATVRGSLYGTAKNANISYKLIRQMTDIFNWEINFAKEVRAGDQFGIVYKAYYVKDKMVDVGEILAVTYTLHGTTHQAIRHVTKSGDYDYYTPQGMSLKKAFIRYPVKFSHISSTYSLSRYHPILHYRRPHHGIDLAAAIGTPVRATGDGRIEIIDRHSGYGNMVKVTHNKTYSTIYAHLLRFQKGLARGDFVKRGDVIGYVGQTGLADGPHCHYEFHINHQPKNPATVELPRGAPIPARERMAFKSKANTLLAQLKLFQDAQVVKIKKGQDTG